MPYTHHETDVPIGGFGHIDPDLLARIPVDAMPDEHTVTVTFDYRPGTPPSGLSGPPEGYDPGEGEEFYITGPIVLPAPVEAAIIDWLENNWDRPDDGPDPDYYRDMKLDDELGGRDD